MRVLLDTFWWQSGPPSNRAVVRELTAKWRRDYPEDQLFAAIHRNDLEAIDLPSGVVPVAARLRPHGLFASLELPRLARQIAADRVLAQNFTPVTGRSAVFIHDVIFQEHPQWFSPMERAYLAPIPLLARRASVVFTSSHTEAARIHRLNPSLPRVVPTGLAVKSELTDVKPIRPPIGQVRGFVLSVGRLNIRKNLGNALVGALRSGLLSPDFPMLVVGSGDGRSEDLNTSVREAVQAQHIQFLGSLSDAEVSWLYRNADCFVFVSRDEGFGLPPIEAQAFGTPLVVSDIPVMREVCGDQALFVDPDSPTDIGAAITQAVRSKPSPHQRPEYQWSEVVRLIRSEMTQVR